MARMCFADQRFRENDEFPSRKTGDRVFFNINVTESWDWHRVFRWFAAQWGFVTRAYVVNDEHLWDRVRASNANISATDKVRNHRWAQVGNGPFALHRPA